MGLAVLVANVCMCCNVVCVCVLCAECVCVRLCFRVCVSGSVLYMHYFTWVEPWLLSNVYTLPIALPPTYTHTHIHNIMQMVGLLKDTLRTGCQGTRLALP